MSKERKTISFVEVARVSKWLSDNAAGFNMLTATAVAEAAQQALGLTVTTGTIKDLCAELGIKLKIRGQGTAQSAQPSDRVQALAMEVKLLYEQLGVQPSARLIALTRKQAL